MSNERKISPFYRTSSPIGAAALPPPMKTKEKVEQGKGTADHLMPLGFLLIFEFFLTKLKPTKIKRLECPKNNNHHTVVYFGKAITAKPKKIENCGWSYFVALLKFFPMVIWFLILEFFLTNL